MTSGESPLLKRVAGNVVWGGGAKALAILLNVVTVPLFLGKLGSESYAIYALVMSLLGITGMMNVGVGEATIQRMTQAFGRGRTDDVTRYFRNGLAVQMAVGVLGWLFLGFVAPLLFEGLRGLDRAQMDLAGRALFWFGGGWVLRNVNAALYTVPIAKQRYDLAIAVREGATVFERFMAVGILVSGRGLVAIFAAQVVAQGVATIVALLLNHRLLPGLGTLPRLELGALKETLRMGAWQSIASLTGDLTYTLDRWLVGLLISAQAAAYYSAVLTVTVSAAGALGSLGAVLFPTFADLHARNRRPGATRLFVLGTWMLGLLGTVLYVPLFVFAHPVLSVWLGEEVASQTAWLLRVLVAGQILMGPSLLQPIFLVGIGRTRRNAVLGTIALALGTISNIAALLIVGDSGMGWSRLVPGLVWAAGLLTMRQSFFPELPKAWFVSGLFGAACAMLLLFVFVLPMTHALDQIDWTHLSSLGVVLVGSGLAGLTWLLTFDRWLPGSRDRRALVLDTMQSVFRA